MTRRLETYRDFWPFYLGEHGRAGTRALHYLGTGLGLVLFAAGAASGRWWLVPAALVAAYACAWAGHAFVERNRPASFRHPLWSLVSDLRMFGLWIAGRLGRERRRLGLDEPTSAKRADEPY